MDFQPESLMQVQGLRARFCKFLSSFTSCSSCEEGEKLFLPASSSSHGTEGPILYILKSIVKPWVQLSEEDRIWSFIHSESVKTSSGGALAEENWQNLLKFRWPRFLRVLSLFLVQLQISWDLRFSVEPEIASVESGLTWWLGELCFQGFFASFSVLFLNENFQLSSLQTKVKK